MNGRCVIPKSGKLCNLQISFGVKIHHDVKKWPFMDKIWSFRLTGDFFNRYIADVSGVFFPKKLLTDRGEKWN